MHFLKNHWFGALMWLMILAAVFLAVAVLFSPRQDLDRRGFIPCTETMADDMLACNKSLGCMLKAVVANSWCDIKVIGRGVKLWLTGAQTAPWSNYWFTPRLEEQDPGLEEFYRKNPDLPKQMRELKKLNEELENDDTNIEKPGIPGTEQPAGMESEGSV